MSRYYLIVLFLCLVGNAHAEQYLCIVNKSTGFIFSESSKSWQPTSFKAESKYTLSNSKGTYSLYSFGLEKPIASCGTGFNEAGVIFCDGWVFFHFIKKVVDSLLCKKDHTT